MKKELILHFIYMITFFLLVTLFRGWYSYIYWPFWVGGIIGTLLPDIDHLIYSFALNPQDHTSQRVAYLAKEKNVKKAVEILSNTRYDRGKPVFHTIYFQLIFLVLTFWVVTSSGTPFGVGLVLAFYLHLLIDQLVDYYEVGSISSWFDKLPLILEADRSRIYWIIMLSLLLVMGFFF